MSVRSLIPEQSAAAAVVGEDHPRRRQASHRWRGTRVGTPMGPEWMLFVGAEELGGYRRSGHLHPARKNIKGEVYITDGSCRGFNRVAATTM